MVILAMAGNSASLRRSTLMLPLMGCFYSGVADTFPPATRLRMKALPTIPAIIVFFMMIPPVVVVFEQMGEQRFAVLFSALERTVRFQDKKYMNKIRSLSFFGNFLQLVFVIACRLQQFSVQAFRKHLSAQGGTAERIIEVVSDMSAAFIAGVKAHVPNSSHTVDWFHVVQLFTKAVDEVRRAEAKETKLPKATRWATLKNADGPLTEKQINALAELMSMDTQTSKAWRIKEMLRWVRKATSMRGAQWRLTNFMNVALKLVADIDLLKPVRKALKTVGNHREAIL
ncbi:MAG: transposase, partial [bacterium]|nr:transposase [bacterium]